MNGLTPFRAFEERVEDTRRQLLAFIGDVHTQGKIIAALGASTKGNVLLQYCGITERSVVAVGEVNEEKFGCFTPGSWIPIVPEAELLSQAPDYLLVLPWHFRSFFEQSSAFAKARLVFPLPKLEVVERSDKTSELPG